MICPFSSPDVMENHRKGKAQSRKIEKEKVYAIGLNVGKLGTHENWLKKNLWTIKTTLTVTEFFLIQ